MVLVQPDGVTWAVTVAGETPSNTPSLRNLGVAAVFVGAQAVRMRLEELALAEEFPEYAGYAAETPRIVPLLSRRRRLGPVAIGRGR